MQGSAKTQGSKQAQSEHNKKWSRSSTGLATFHSASSQPSLCDCFIPLPTNPHPLAASIGMNGHRHARGRGRIFLFKKSEDPFNWKIYWPTGATSPQE